MIAASDAGGGSGNDREAAGGQQDEDLEALAQHHSRGHAQDQRYHHRHNRSQRSNLPYSGLISV
jgi:hypothetical protein